MRIEKKKKREVGKRKRGKEERNITRGIDFLFSSTPLAMAPSVREQGTVGKKEGKDEKKGKKEKDKPVYYLTASTLRSVTLFPNVERGGYFVEPAKQKDSRVREERGGRRRGKKGNYLPEHPFFTSSPTSTGSVEG